jgi:cytochrome P450
LDLSDLPEHKWQTALPVLTAALKETMRLYPAAGNISRMAVEADIIGDLEIKPGTAVSTAPWVLHRHQKIWENPDTFDPRRFMGTAADKIHRYAYLPFGAGPRVCVGASFAMQEMIIILAKYLKAFRFTHTGTEAPMPLMQITIQPTTPLMMGIEKR